MWLNSDIFQWTWHYWTINFNTEDFLKYFWKYTYCSKRPCCKAEQRGNCICGLWKEAVLLHTLRCSPQQNFFRRKVKWNFGWILHKYNTSGILFYIRSIFRKGKKVLTLLLISYEKIQKGQNFSHGFWLSGQTCWCCRLHCNSRER